MRGRVPGSFTVILRFQGFEGFQPRVEDLHVNGMGLETLQP